MAPLPASRFALAAGGFLSCVACGSGGSPEAGAAVALENAFPAHPRYDRPLLFGAFPDGSGRHFVVEQNGRVWVFRMRPDGSADGPRVFLDLSPRVSRIGEEEGLLGLAVHPDFARDPRFFVHYSVRGAARGRLSEFRAAPGDGEKADPSSERVLLEIEQPWRNHNGGHVAFGPDGMLYLALGDGGAAGDPYQSGQNPSTLLGSILRIDPERRSPGLEYGIPEDNPFADRPGWRGEIWALGLRNAWRFSFDPETGLLWAGDVGQNRFEEIDVVEKAGNYGWRLKEGFADYDPRGRRGPGDLRDPVLAYPRSDGWSVTGGHVYRGAGVPEIRGKYLYADYVSGRIWAIEPDPRRPGEPKWLATCDNPASFGIDAWGELYVCCFDGRIYRFVSARR